MHSAATIAIQRAGMSKSGFSIMEIEEPQRIRWKDPPFRISSTMSWNTDGMDSLMSNLIFFKHNPL